mgnify:CR=1 FL=1
MAAMDDEALYLPDGDGFVATLRTQGAWHPDQQHGGQHEGRGDHDGEQRGEQRSDA